MAAAMAELSDLTGLDALVLAVPHQAYLGDVSGLLARIRRTAF